MPEYVVYNQWTYFEEFPWFMERVKEVKQLAPKRLHWRAEMTGQSTEWDAEITEQTADQRLALTYRGCAITGWVATFHELSNPWSTVVLQVKYDTQGSSTMSEMHGKWYLRVFRAIRSD